MNKTEILATILEQLREEFEARRRSSKQTRVEGNDPETKAVSKYDTLAIEENYLADGLAKQAFAASEAIAEIEKMVLREFASDEPIDLGALIEVEFFDGKEWFFLAPAGGGTEVAHARETVTVITPESPLGSKLIGSCSDDGITLPSARILRVM